MIKSLNFIGLITIFVLIVVSSCSIQKKEEDKRPNILFIMGTLQIENALRSLQ